MDNWRRKRSGNHNQEGSRMRSETTNSQGNWQPAVPGIPSWEKKFCWEIGRVPWRKIVETQNLLSAYDNMLKWDDSAGEEAFHNGKARYWAKLNGLPCDIPLPDPNAYIDDVDWDSNLDPELIEDLYRDSVVSDVNKGVLIFGDTYAKSQGLTDGGWGETDGFKMITDTDLEKIRKESCRVYADMAGGVVPQGNADVAPEWGECEWEKKIRESGVAPEGIDHGGQWGDCEWDKKVRESGVAPEGIDHGGEWGDCEWEKKVRESGDGGGKGWNCDSGWDKWESKVNKFGNNWEDNGNNGNYMSRYKTTRFHGDESEFDRNWNNNNNYGGNNGNYRESNGRYKANRVNGGDQGNNQWERNNRSGKRRENIVRDEGFCRPFNYNRSAKQGNNNWSWEKSVK